MTVLVVGAGPVGLTLANLLGAAGVETWLVEANTTTSDSPKAILIDDESFRTFAAIGLADEIAASVVYGTGARYHAANGALLAAVPPSVGAYGFPRRSAFGQPALERVLLAGLARYPTVRTLFSTRFISAETDAGRPAAQVVLEDGEGRQRRAFNWVVGCDGGRSQVRDEAGVAMRGRSFAEPWLIVDTARDPDRSRYTKFLCDPRRPTVSVPAPGGGRRYEFMLMPGEREEDMLTPKGIARLMAGRRQLDDQDIVRKAVYVFHALVAERFGRGRLLLAGDAAHMMPPFAGQGMNSGIRDAANLAWKLALVEQGTARASLVETYDVERRAHVEAMVALSVRLGRIVMSRSLAASMLRDVLFRALGMIPPARSWLASMRWKPQPRVRQGAFVRPGRGLVGSMIPQPHVTLGDGPPAGLDRALGPGFALVSLGGAAARLTHPVWERLGARRVHVLAGDQTPAPRPGVFEVGDIGGSAQRLFGAHGGEILLVRPDRYVAAAFSPAAEHAAALRLVAALAVEAEPPAVSLAA